MIWLVLVFLAFVGSYAFMELRRAPMTYALRATARGSFANLPLGQTHYHWRGPRDGPVVVLVHGLSTPLQVYDSIAQNLANSGARVLAYDLYGRGYSDRPFASHTRAFYRRQLTELLSDQGVTQPFVLVGYSMGGALVADFAARHPDRVSGLCLIAPAGLGHIRDRFGTFARSTPLLGDWAMTVLGARGFRSVAAAASANPGEVPEIGEVMSDELTRRGNLRSILSSLRCFIAQDFTADHVEIASRSVPTIAIWGRTDAVIPLEASQTMAALNPEATQHIIDTGDHAIPYTHGTEIAGLIQKTFLDPPPPQ